MKHILIAVMTVVLLASCASSGESPDHAQDVAKIHTQLASSYYERSQYATALQEVAVALRAQSNYAPAYSVRGLIRMALHEDELADEDFHKSLRLDSSNSETHNNYGWFLCQTGHEKESISHFQEALKNPLYQTPEIAYANAGSCSLKAGDLVAAEKYLQRALILRPGMPQALFGFAQTRFAVGEYASAKSYLSRYQQMVQDLNAEQLWLAVRIERKMHDRNSEASYTLQLKKRYPDSREAQLLQKSE